MTADFKSHVLLRDEKGVFGIPFKRLLLAGISGGMCYTLVRLALPSSALWIGVLCALAVLIGTAPQGGIARWLRWTYRLRGSLLLAQRRTTRGEIAAALDLPTELARLNGEAVFAPLHAASVDLREWVTYAHAWEAQSGDGLAFRDAPLESP
jgi:hypothetical protein